MFPTLWVVNFYDHLVSYSIPIVTRMSLCSFQVLGRCHREISMFPAILIPLHLLYGLKIWLTRKRDMKKNVQGDGKKKLISLRAGFEPAREDPIGFQVQRLNHSAITAHYHLQGEMFIFKYDITSSTLDTSHFKNQKMSEKCGTKTWLVTAKALLLTYGVEKVIQLKSTVVMVHFCLKRKLAAPANTDNTYFAL